MRSNGLLIITQKVDAKDDILGFFLDWIREFARRWPTVTVICLFEGEHDLPDNVTVVSLGKERTRSRLRYLWRFYRYLWHYRDAYGSVFVHMNPIYVPLGWPLWRILGKRISLWYAHGYVPPLLRLAERCADRIFTSTPEGFRLQSKKLKVVGQGIDIHRFQPGDMEQSQILVSIISIGRLSPSKDYETLIRAMQMLKQGKIDVTVRIVGGPSVASDELYREHLLDLTRALGVEEVLQFMGPVSNRAIVPLLRSAHLFVNMSHTGSLDKAMLEAMACGVPVITCNEALAPVLGPDLAKLFMYPKRDAAALAERITDLCHLAPERFKELSRCVREIVVRDHALERLGERITTLLHNE